ncbi:HAD family hydrolase [bacterium]|nr:HAD family hydrolase [bacterium]
MKKKKEKSKLKSGLVLLFDLDDTLIQECESEMAAFLETSKAVAHYGISPKDFADTIKVKAREAWRSLPTYPYCHRIQIASWEGLWGEFDGDDPQIERLRQLKESYRFMVWNNALQAYGLHDVKLADHLSRKYIEERRKRHMLFPETIEVLQDLAERYRLALITNGAPDLQWSKIRGGKLAEYFHPIIISGNIGFGKPDLMIFQSAFSFFPENDSVFIMIGNSLESDIAGAQHAGIKSIWLNRTGTINISEYKPDYEIQDLREISNIVASIPVRVHGNKPKLG